MLCASRSFVRSCHGWSLIPSQCRPSHDTPATQLTCTHTTFMGHPYNKANPKHCFKLSLFYPSLTLSLELLLLISCCINKQGENKRRKKHPPPANLTLSIKKRMLNLSRSCTKNLLHHLQAEILLLWIYIVLKGHWLFKS